MSNAYVIGHITVKDTEKWNEYRNQVPATVKPWGAELVLRGKLASILAGEHTCTDTVVIRSPDMKAVDRRKPGVSRTKTSRHGSVSHRLLRKR